MLKNLLLVICSVTIVFFWAELATRYLARAWPFEEALYELPHLTARDATLRWRYSRADDRNSLGLRNREIGPKTPEVYRILFLGDSLVWSGETSSGALFTDVLERGLNERRLNADSSFEVINAGIPGYTTWQELEFLKLYGLEMKPDLVILGFVFNDLYYPYVHKPTKEDMLDGDPGVHLYHFDPDTFPGSLFARSYLAHQIVARSQILWKLIRRQPVFSFEKRGDFYLAWKPYGWTHARELIEEMRALLMKRGISLAVVAYPIRDQMDDRFRQLDEAYVLLPQRQLREICQASSIPLLDLTETLYAHGGTALFRDYLHLNARGNDRIAEEILTFLVTGFNR
jgi:lysophospholipase L1-like esterase